MKEGGHCGVSEEGCVGYQNIYRTKSRGSTMKKERGNCGMWGGGGVDGDRKDYIRTKNETINISRNLERKERERGGGSGGEVEEDDRKPG